MMVSFAISGLIALGQIGSAQPDSSPERIDALIAQIESADASIRKTAIEALGEIGPPARKAVPALESLGDRDWRALSARRRIGPGPEPFPHRVHSVVVPGEYPHVERRQYFLHVDETGQDIRLGTTREYVGEDDSTRGEKEGLDAESILIRWLEPHRLLHVQWITISRGGGRYQAQGNVILLNSGEKWRELLRDWRHYYDRSGASDYSRMLLAFGWDPENETMTLAQLDIVAQSHVVLAPGPLVDSYGADGSDPMYCHAYRVEKSWRAEIVNDKLAFEEGQIALGLEPNPSRSQRDAPRFTVRRAAEFVAQSPEFSVERDAAKQLDYILQHHPELNADSTCPERLLVGDGIAPSEPNGIEMLSTGDNTSW